MKNPRMPKVARDSAMKLLACGALKKRWTPFERQQWTRAFNALQRLAGKKMVWRKRGLTSRHA